MNAESEPWQLTASAAYGQFTEPVSIGKSRFGAEVRAASGCNMPS